MASMHHILGALSSSEADLGFKGWVLNKGLPKAAKR